MFFEDGASVSAVVWDNLLLAQVVPETSKPWVAGSNPAGRAI